jgi:DNA-binding transcriptional MerR regulator
MTRYRMKAVSRMTGVRPELLRRWEKRYRLFKPQRAGNRYREFDEEDVQLLLYIRQQIDQGRSIGELAAEGREALLRQFMPDAESAVQANKDQLNLLDELTAYIQQLNRTRLESRLAECMLHYPFMTLLNTVLTPLMHRLGDLYMAGRLSIASERLMTMLLQQRLFTMLQMAAPSPEAPLLLCACPPGEQHELGILAFAYAIQQDGWQICYLGADLPISALQHSCQQLQPALVALSFTYAGESERRLEILHMLDSAIAPIYPTILGGQYLAACRHLLQPRHLMFCETPQAALAHVRQIV